jgi:hypothetical protein
MIKRLKLLAMKMKQSMWYTSSFFQQSPILNKTGPSIMGNPMISYGLISELSRNEVIENFIMLYMIIILVVYKFSFACQ